MTEMRRLPDKECEVTVACTLGPPMDEIDMKKRWVM